MRAWLQNEIKLGDLGLAKQYDAGLGDVASQTAGGPSVPPTEQHSSSRTGVVGTSFYIAPEIRAGWARYDSKVWVGNQAAY